MMINMIKQIGNILGKVFPAPTCEICSSQAIDYDGTCMVCEGWIDHEDVWKMRKLIAYEGIDLSHKYILTKSDTYIPYTFDEHNKALVEGIFKEIVDWPLSSSASSKICTPALLTCKNCGEELQEFGCINCDKGTIEKIREKSGMNTIESLIRQIKHRVGPYHSIENIKSIIDKYGSCVSIDRSLSLFQGIDYALTSKRVEKMISNRRYSIEQTENKEIYKFVKMGVEYTLTKTILTKEEQRQKLISTIQSIQNDMLRWWNVTDSHELLKRIERYKVWVSRLEYKRNEMFILFPNKRALINESIRYKLREIGHMEMYLDELYSYMNKLVNFFPYIQEKPTHNHRRIWRKQ